MTENKRYVEICNDLWHYIRDSETFAKYDLNEVVDLLNELYDENEELKQQIKEVKAHNNWLVTVLQDSGAIVEIKKGDVDD